MFPFLSKVMPLGQAFSPGMLMNTEEAPVMGSTFNTCLPPQSTINNLPVFLGS